jgi:hypothetical protein
MIEYKLVFGRIPEELSEKVTQLLKENWSLHGSPMLDENGFFQAMVLYVPENAEVLPGYIQMELGSPEEIIAALYPVAPEGIVAYP